MTAETWTQENWKYAQPHHCYFHPGRDCPGWHRDQPCQYICQRMGKSVQKAIDKEKEDKGA